MATTFVSGQGTNDTEAAAATSAEKIASAIKGLPNRLIPAAPACSRKRDAVSQILKKELADMADEKKRLSTARAAIGTKIKPSNRRRRRLLNKLKTTPTQDLVLMIRAREHDETMERASEMATETPSPNA